MAHAFFVVVACGLGLCLMALAYVLWPWPMLYGLVLCLMALSYVLWPVLWPMVWPMSMGVNGPLASVKKDGEGLQ